MGTIKNSLSTDGDGRAIIKRNVIDYVVWAPREKRREMSLSHE